MPFIIKNPKMDSMIENFIIADTRSIRLHVSKEKISEVRQKLKKLEEGTLTEGIADHPNEINFVTKHLRKPKDLTLQEIMTHSISEKEIYFLTRILVETGFVGLEERNILIQGLSCKFIQLRAFEMAESCKNFMNVLQEKKLDSFLPFFSKLLATLQKISQSQIFTKGDIKNLTKYKCRVKMHQNECVIFLDESLQKEFQQFGNDFSKFLSGVPYFSFFRLSSKYFISKNDQALQRLMLN